MEHKKSRWHKKRVGGTKKESVEQNQSRPGIFKESVPYHPGAITLVVLQSTSLPNSRVVSTTV